MLIFWDGWTFGRIKPSQSVDVLTFAKIIVNMLKNGSSGQIPVDLYFVGHLSTRLNL